MRVSKPSGDRTMKVVLDTSVIAKALMKPRKSLPKEVFKREIETHRKAKLIIRICDYHEVLLPRAGLVEVASVLKRNGHERLIPQILESLSLSYAIIPEGEFFEDAIEVASRTGAAGFDCYFMALALGQHALLITDDVKMERHAKSLGIRSLLVRALNEDEITEVLSP